MSGPCIYIAVVGAGSCGAEDAALAEEVGRRLAEAGATLVCGGLGGVMEAACRGSMAKGGMTVGLLPNDGRQSANPYVRVAIPTGLGEARNALVVRAADAVIATRGEFGTLSEIALALKIGKPVVGLDTWELSKRGRRTDPIVRAGCAQQAVDTALELARQVCD